MIPRVTKEQHADMRRKEPDISLSVVNWPVYGRVRSFSLAKALFPSRDDLAAWARKRFGRGELVETGGDRWEYRREVTGPAGLWCLFTKLLNRSFD